MATFPYFTPANLLPVTIYQYSLLSNPISSLSINGPPLQAGQTADTQNLQNPILISTATLTRAPAGTINTVILSAGNIPLAGTASTGTGHTILSCLRSYT